jgi:hypothetical protein
LLLGVPLRDEVAHAVVHTVVKAASAVTASLSFACEPKTGQRHPAETDAEFPQRPAARDRLRHALRQFIEIVVHTIPFIWLFVVCRDTLPKCFTFFSHNFPLLTVRLLFGG